MSKKGMSKLNVNVEIQEEKGLYLRVNLVSGNINGESFSVSANADGMAIFFEFENSMYKMGIKDILQKAYQYHKDKKVESEAENG